MSEPIDLTLHLEPAKTRGLQHEVHKDHTHFYYQEWELENSPVSNPPEYKKQWIEISTIYSSDGIPYSVKVKEIQE